MSVASLAHESFDFATMWSCHLWVRDSAQHRRFPACLRAQYPRAGTGIFAFLQCSRVQHPKYKDRQRRFSSVETEQPVELFPRKAFLHAFRLGSIRPLAVLKGERPMQSHNVLDNLCVRAKRDTQNQAVVSPNLRNVDCSRFGLALILLAPA